MTAVQVRGGGGWGGGGGKGEGRLVLCFDVCVTWMLVTVIKY